MYVVAYDLNSETARPNITKAIKEYEWALLSESSYAIDTDESPTVVYNNLRQFIDENDWIYVITLKRPWMGIGHSDAIAWLDARLQ